MEKTVLDEQWLRETACIQIIDDASVSLAREQVRKVGAEALLDHTMIENMAVVASELARNQISHARRGELVVRKIARAGVAGLEIVAADQGKGIGNPRAALCGETSTSSTLGAGLSAVYRLSDETDFDIRLGEGTCIWARKFSTAPAPLRCELAILGRPYPGEVRSGDGGIFIRDETGVLAAVADGLGHGLMAHEAAVEAIHCVQENANQPPDSLLVKCNVSVSGTRGSAMSLVRVRTDTEQAEHAGAGDVSTSLYHLNRAKKFIAVPHTLGHPWENTLPRIESWPVAAGTVLAMYTDGFKTETTLQGEFEVLRQPAVVIAHHLLEKFGRNNDDALVLVAKFGRHMASALTKS
ncbi:MAG: SpoIIE family protein phosphatase [bacterium]|nr:SpoIIE family protein phosphatase [bacterium]